MKTNFLMPEVYRKRFIVFKMIKHNTVLKIQYTKLKYKFIQNCTYETAIFYDLKKLFIKK